jgi:oligopeptide/dipeptide ABC transporter ATP-binding protein
MPNETSAAQQAKARPADQASQGPVLSVEGLEVVYDSPYGEVQAVSDASFEIRRGETFALVGESGCGKSTTAAAIMRLLRRPGRVKAGRVLSHGQDLLALPEAEMEKVRGRRIGMIFQNPLDSLNPVYTIGDQIAESLMADGMGKAEALERAEEMLVDVRFPDAAERMRQYPHEISGGMRQRVMIAMMLCREPEVLIADEPTTALDVTTQAEILDLMGNLRREHGMSILLITHDFGIVAEMADRVAVMYAGQIVEMGSVFEIFDQPLHPYTRLLMQALPTLRRGEGRLKTIPGTVPDLTCPPAGCRFHDRCPLALDACADAAPRLVEVSPGHLVACGRTVTADE